MIKSTHHVGALTLAAALTILGVAGTARPLAADSGDGPGISRTELGRLDLFLDSHPDIAKALQANPSQATSKDFLSENPAWRAFLEDHAGIRQSLTTNPSAFMQREDQLDATESKLGPPKSILKEPMSDQFSAFDKFLDQNPAIAKQLEANPSLIKQKDYVADHPQLEAFLKNQPTLRDSLLDSPNAFMKGVAAVDAAEASAPAPKPTSSGSSSSSSASGSSSSASNGSKPTMPPTKAPAGSDALTQSQLTKLDAFLDTNPGLTKQLESKPWLINDTTFLKDNPKLADFLTANPGIREDWRADPAAAMVALNRIDQLQAAKAPHAAGQAQIKSDMATFEDFLDQHPVLAKELQANPSLIKDQSYLKNNPELVKYLESNASIRDAFVDNPQGFMKGVESDVAAEANSKPPSPDPGTMPPTKAPAPTDTSLNRTQMVTVDNFLDANSGLAKQLEANPNLINNQDFRTDHPDLVAFLGDHPEIAAYWKDNSSLVMTDVRRVDNIESARAIGNVRAIDTRSAVENFDNFLDNHPVIAAQIDHHSSQASNVSFIDSNPELKSYLQKNPGVAAELRNNPQSFMNLLSNFDKHEAAGAQKKEDLKPKVAKLSH